MRRSEDVAREAVHDEDPRADVIPTWVMFAWLGWLAAAGAVAAVLHELGVPSPVPELALPGVAAVGYRWAWIRRRLPPAPPHDEPRPLTRALVALIALALAFLVATLVATRLS